MKSNTTYALLVLVLAFVFASCSYQAMEVPQVSEDEALLATLDSRGMRPETEREKTLKPINKILDNMEKGKFDKVLNYLSDDVVWFVDGEGDGATPLAGTYTGKQGVKSYFDQFSSLVKILDMKVRYHLVQGDRVNSHVIVKGKVFSTGKVFDIEFVYAWQLNANKKVKHLETYYCTFTFDLAFTQGGPLYVKDLRSTNESFFFGQTNVVDMANEVYAKFGAGDIPALIDLFADEGSLWVLKGDTPNVPYANVFVGKPGIQEFFNNLFATNGYKSFVMGYYVTEGNRVDFYGHEECYSLKTGEPYSCNFIHSFIVNEEGKLTEFNSTNSSYAVSEAHTPD